MGTWGHNLVESDNAYDFLYEIETWIPSNKLYNFIKNEYTQEEYDWSKEVFKNNKFSLLKMALITDEYHKNSNVLIYIAFFKVF